MKIGWKGRKTLIIVLKFLRMEKILVRKFGKLSKTKETISYLSILSSIDEINSELSNIVVLPVEVVGKFEENISNIEKIENFRIDDNIFMDCSEVIDILLSGDDSSLWGLDRITDIDKFIEKVKKSIYFLVSVGSVKIPVDYFTGKEYFPKNITIRRFFSYLELYLGKELTNKIIDVFLLDQEEIDLLKKSIVVVDKRGLDKSLPPELLRFLPEDIRLKDVKKSLLRDKKSEVLDVLKEDTIGKYIEIEVDKKLSEKIYDTFSIGMILKADDIKLILGNIYISLGITKTPKVKDLESYFTIKNSTNGYRILKL